MATDVVTSDSSESRADYLTVRDIPGMRVLGQLTAASNGSLLCELGDGRRVIYKPTRGERPLWDFPHGTLGRREVLACELAHALSVAFVPPTVWVEDAPLGPGSVQLWCDLPTEDLVRVEPVDVLPEEFVSAISGEGAHGEPVHLVHLESAELQRIAIFDTITNNADRKAGHLLGARDAIVAIDHGLCFHPEPKMRTVLWGWAGEAIPDDLITWLRPIEDESHPVYSRVENFLGSDESEALHGRVQQVLRHPVFPRPSAEGPSLPWPLW